MPIPKGRYKRIRVKKTPSGKTLLFGIRSTPGPKGGHTELIEVK